MKSYLKGLGATEVVTDSESGMFGDTMPKLFDVSTSSWSSVAIFCISSQLHGRPILGLNCVGGKSASTMMKHLAYVQYWGY